MKKILAETLTATHFLLEITGPIATVTLNLPERKNPLTFDSYFELTQFFRSLAYVDEIKVVVITGAGGNFSSGGDVHEIIGPLTRMEMPQLLEFTRMTGEAVRAMRLCPQPIFAAIEGVCAGAGAILAMASDFRIGTLDSKIAFLFARVGLAGCDMGACSILPRIIGQTRAAELLYTGRVMKGDEAERVGFLNRLVPAGEALENASAWARDIAGGPTFAHSLTKRMLHQEWDMSIDAAIEAEAQAQALAMKTNDFRRAYEAFAAKKTPVFAGN